METSLEAQKKPNKGLMIAVALIIVLLLVIVFKLFFGQKDDSGRIQYASEATVVLDEDALSEAMYEAMKNAERGNIALWYNNNAYSEDGVNFIGFVGNSKANLYDCFLTMFADSQLTDQIFLSGLIPPGSGFKEITLDRALPEGANKVYVAITQVEDDENGQQTIIGQAVYSMNFNVKPEE